MHGVPILTACNFIDTTALGIFLIHAWATWSNRMGPLHASNRLLHLTWGCVPFEWICASSFHAWAVFSVYRGLLYFILSFDASRGASYLYMRHLLLFVVGLVSFMLLLLILCLRGVLYIQCGLPCSKCVEFFLITPGFSWSRGLLLQSVICELLSLSSQQCVSSFHFLCKTCLCNFAIC